jgi:hypothetical protein
MSEQKPKHEWQGNVEYLIEYLFNEPFEKEGDNGSYYQYSIKSDGVEKVMFASPDLKVRMDALGSLKGDQLKITKQVDGKRFVSWLITKVSDNPEHSYAEVKSGNAPMKSKVTYGETEDERWVKINRDKQLSIIAGQSMNLAVKTVLELIIANCPQVNAEEFDLEVLKYRDKYYDMMANFNPAETQAANETDEDKLPF